MKKRRLFLPLFLMLTLIFSLTFSAAAAETEGLPNIYGKSAITIDMQTGEIIYAKDIDAKRYPASTTKLLTALILAESKKKSDPLTYTAGSKVQEEYSLTINLHAIDVGETMTADNAMDGLLLYSGNDVAYMIAENVGKDAKDFETVMNKKIKSLNLKNTHFVTPNGLHDDNHYTTAYDLSVIARSAFANPWVKESMGKATNSIKTSKGTTFVIENRNKLLGKDGCIGGKTGYTSKAGRCLVTIYERNGRKLLGVVMDSLYDQNDSFVFDDMKKIIDWSYSKKPSTLHKKDSVIETKEIKYKPLHFFGPSRTIKVPLVIKEDINYFDNGVNKQEVKEDLKLSNINTSSLKGKDSIGTLSVKERDFEKSYKLYSDLPKGALFKNSLAVYIGASVIFIVSALAIGFGIKKVIDIRRRKRRGKYI